MKARQYVGRSIGLGTGIALLSIALFVGMFLEEWTVRGWPGTTGMIALLLCSWLAYKCKPVL
jgi:hypothetical protein